MRVKASQIDPLAKHILTFLKEKKLASFQQSEDILLNLLCGVFRRNLEDEEKLNEEARRLLEANKKKIGLNIDEERALNMIKKQLAKERGFIL